MYPSVPELQKSSLLLGEDKTLARGSAQLSTNHNLFSSSQVNFQQTLATVRFYVF